MNNIYEELVMLYFIGKGYRVSRNTNFGSTNPQFKDEVGTCDFTIWNEKDEKIYVEVKTETSPNFTSSQLKFIEKCFNEKIRVWVVLVSRLGSFLVFEIKNLKKIVLIKKGFFKLKKNAFYLNANGRISLLDFRFDKQLVLEDHLKKLREIRENDRR